MYTSVSMYMLVFIHRVFNVHQCLHVYVGIQSQSVYTSVDMYMLVFSHRVFNVHQCLHAHVGILS